VKRARRLTEQLLGDADLGVFPQAAAYGAPVTAMRSAAPDLGFDLSHHKRGGMTVSIEYRVEGFEPAVARSSP